VRFELFFDTAVSEIRLDDDDAASCSGSSTPTTLLRKLLAGQLSLDSPHAGLSRTRSSDESRPGGAVTEQFRRLV
jgi:hypothetical protein